jgi:hypothetical protein
MFISNYLGYYYLDFYIKNLDKIIQFYFNSCLMQATLAYNSCYPLSNIVIAAALAAARNVTLKQSFQVDTLKGIFPHRFVNKVNLDYNGDMPSYEYFDKITIEEYNNLCCKHAAATAVKSSIGKAWNLKSEAIKYCVTLYKVLNKFKDLIYDKLKININKIII